MINHKLFANPFRAALTTLLVHVESARRRLRHARRTAAARRTLMRLNDATLRDLGMDRTEIGSVVSEAYGDARRSRLRLSWQPCERL
jgi:uncharacterized protein YjiS (DUF1127 family)